MHCDCGDYFPYTLNLDFDSRNTVTPKQYPHLPHSSLLLVFRRCHCSVPRQHSRYNTAFTCFTFFCPCFSTFQVIIHFFVFGFSRHWRLFIRSSHRQRKTRSLALWKMYCWKTRRGKVSCCRREDIYRRCLRDLRRKLPMFSLLGAFRLRFLSDFPIPENSGNHALNAWSACQKSHFLSPPDSMFSFAREKIFRHVSPFPLSFFFQTGKSGAFQIFQAVRRRFLGP